MQQEELRTDKIDDVEDDEVLSSGRGPLVSPFGQNELNLRLIQASST